MPATSIPTQPRTQAPPPRTAPRRPPRAHNTLPSFLLAVCMHLMLVAALWFAVQWHTDTDSPAAAELWELSPTPDVATPPPPPPPPPPVQQPEPPQPQADIVEKVEKPKPAPEPPPPPPPKVEPKKEPPKEEPKPEQKKPPEDVKKVERQAELRRQQELARIAGAAGGTTSAASPSAAGGGGHGDPTYQGRIKACVKGHLVFAVPDDVSPSAEADFAVELLPTGDLASVRLTKPSGLPGYDEAAERAIRRCDPFPRPIGDTPMPRNLVLQLKPTESQ